MGIVKIHCGECVKDFGGNSGELNNHTVSNLFANFKKHHLHTNAYIKSLCRRLGLPYTNHPQLTAPKDKFVVLSYADHERLVQEGAKILEHVNDTTDKVDGQNPFYIVGDMSSNKFKYRLYWFKVHCRLCGDFFQLCPPKKNRHLNLVNHLKGLKHSKLLADCTTSKKSNSSTLSIRQRRRPSKSTSGSSYNQADLHGWFKRVGDGGELSDHFNVVF